MWQWFFLHSCVGQWSSSSLERRGSERGLPLLLLPCGWPHLPLASSSLPLLLPTLCCYSTPPVCHPSIYLIYISLRARVRACVCVRVCAWAGWLAGRAAAAAAKSIQLKPASTASLQKEERLYSTCASPVVPHLSTRHAHGCLASEIGRDPAFPTRYDRTENSSRVSSPDRLAVATRPRSNINKDDPHHILMMMI